MTPKRSKPLLKAIEAAGSLGKIAKHLNLTRQAVSAWPEVPLKYMVEIASLTGLSIKRLRPDLFEGQK